MENEYPRKEKKRATNEKIEQNFNIYFIIVITCTMKIDIT